MKFMLDASVRTHCGKIRGNNEDNFYLCGQYRTDVMQKETAVSGSYAGDCFLAAVADGMGGEEHGELASLLMVQALQPCCFEQVRQNAKACIQQVNVQICNEIEKNGGRRMGSTFAALYIDDGKALCCNIGDSRVYLYRDGQLRLLSTDHNKAARMVELGALTREQAARHPSRHELTQHLGIFEKEMVLEPAFSQEMELIKGDVFLLCSDGLTDMVPEEKIAARLADGGSTEEQTKELMQMALAAGGKDNVTVLSVHVRKREEISSLKKILRFLGGIIKKALRKEPTEAQKDKIKERQKKLREEMEQLKLQQQRQREEMLKKWKEIDPAESEHISLWEALLERDCAMSKHYVVSGCGDEDVDDTHDGTNVDWFWLHASGNLEKTIEMYAQINIYRKACEAHGIYAQNTNNSVLYWLMNRYYDQRFLILSSEEQFAALGEKKEYCMALCREHDLHIVSGLPEHRFEDYVSGNIYQVYVAGTFSGSADDAATFGDLALRVVGQKNSKTEE